MDLKAYRSRLDTIDDEFVRLFKERMDTVAGIAAYKKKHGIGTQHKEREREILSRVSALSGEELEGYTRVLFSTLFDLSRSHQNRLINGETGLSREISSAIQHTPQLFPPKALIACQGIEGGNSQLASDRLFSFANIMYFKNFEGVFQAVEKGLCEYGILPIENTLYGTVNEVYDLMRNYKFYIARSIKLRIHHALLGKPGAELSGIKKILSHEQALGQCAKFLKSLPDVTVIPCENTAVAAKTVAEAGDPTMAAISNGGCAELYGLSVLKNDIQDSDHNYTRFICISKDLKIFPGSNRISLMLSIPHRPGALYGIIAKFSALGVNLTKLESRPIPGSDFEFLFYFDMDASIHSPGVIQLLGELCADPELFVFLGCYQEF